MYFILDAVEGYRPSLRRFPLLVLLSMSFVRDACPLCDPEPEAVATAGVRPSGDSEPEAVVIAELCSTSDPTSDVRATAGVGSFSDSELDVVAMVGNVHSGIPKI